MKIVINRSWGGGSERMIEGRRDPKLIREIEDGRYTKISFEVPVIAIIPDNVTDWFVQSYDGMENVIYVLDGKMYYTAGGDSFRVNSGLEGELEHGN